MSIVESIMMGVISVKSSKLLFPIVCVCGLLLLLSCGRENEDALVPVSFAEPMAAAADCIESIRLIPLETNGRFVSWQADVVCGTDRYYVVDKNSSHIYRYAADGAYLGTVGDKGNGPGEYPNIYNVQLAGDRVLVFSAPDATVSTFDADGHFLQKDRIDLAGGQFAEVDEGFLTFHGYGTPASCKASLWKDGKVTDFCPYKSSVIAFEDANPVFTENDGAVYIREQLDRTVYRYSKGRVEPWLSFDFGAYRIDDRFYELDYMASAEYLMGEDYAMLTRYHEADGRRFAEWTRPQVRQSGYGLFLNGSWVWFVAGEEEKDPFAAAIKCLDGSDLVCLVDPSLVGKIDSRLLDKMENPEVLQNIKDTDNHIIVRMHLKE